jgi:hypothetical protein
LEAQVIAGHRFDPRFGPGADPVLLIIVQRIEVAAEAFEQSQVAGETLAARRGDLGNMLLSPPRRSAAPRKNDTGGARSADRANVCWGLGRIFGGSVTSAR